MTTDEASVTNSTSVMMTTVAGDENAIGYISLGSLDDPVKAVKIDGVEATVDNVSNDSYKIARPFNILTSDKESDVAKDFVNYIMSSDGQKIVEDNGYIKEAADAKAYEAADGVSGKVVVVRFFFCNTGYGKTERSIRKSKRRKDHCRSTAERFHNGYHIRSRRNLRHRYGIP